MHGAYLVLLTLAGLAGVWVVVLLGVSHLSGWASLADQYRCLEPFSGSCWNFQSGQFRWYGSYNKCLTVGADPHGLFLRVFPLFRVAHPPLFIPWREISVSRHKVLWIKQVRFQLGRELKIPFTVRDGLAQKIQSAAGSSWPIESAAN